MGCAVNGPDEATILSRRHFRTRWHDLQRRRADAQSCGRNIVMLSSWRLKALGELAAKKSAEEPELVTAK